MKKYIIYLFFLISTIIVAQTIEYSGIVKIKGDKYPLPGVTILVKGAEISTQTDFDGKFKIIVPDSLKIISFSYLGVKPMEYKLGKESFLEIELKEDCNICFLDAQQISIYAQNGILDNPIGGEFNLSFPTIFGKPTLKSGIGYQTNLRENSLLDAYLNLEHLFFDCGYRIDLNSSFQSIHFKNNIDSKRYSIETGTNFNGIKALIGYSNISFTNLSANRIINSNGPLIGLGTRIGRPFYVTVFVKTSIYKNLSEYQAEIRSSYRGISGFIKYNKIGSFNEVSLGIGIQFTYYLKRREKS
ncbi:carboxypeptidase-like regulatory domain-containing protein [uncultured Croceitalea sp.]|uniref:carboxypeptidase-like regulatory domain-containing protein n=1 Tax=uncultured Croceitalea sp. TaxID=1798908 RepID=UPI00374EA91D